jgi:4-diphosphocytidyl-2-C-methyl-D-erythritol kinase
VPWAAGLGGGSSDAASTLLALNRLWGLHWPRERLLTLAAKIGADVPFFVGGHNAFVEGIGERLTPIEVPWQWLAVVKPAAGLSTADVFAYPALVRDTPSAILAGFLAETTHPGFWQQGWGRNDLQPPAEDRCPEVAQAAEWLQSKFGNSRMSGSGSAVFARNGMDDQPLVTWPQENAVPAGWVGRMCRSLDRHPLADWAD